MPTLAPSRLPRLSAKLIAAAAVVACAGGLLMASVGSLPGGRRMNSVRPEPTPPPLSAVLPLLGLDRVSLAVAEVSDQGVEATHAAVSVRITNDWPSFHSLRSQRDLARLRAERPPTADGNGNVPTPAALKQAAAQAQSALTAWLESTRQAAIADLSAEQRAALNQIYANRESGLPIEFRTLSLSQADMVKLRDALSQRARAAELNEALGNEAAAFISSLESATILAARTRANQAAALIAQDVP